MLSAACLNSDAYLSEMAVISLRVALAELTPEHYGQLGSEAVPILCRLLQRCMPLRIAEPDADNSFALELLAALEKIGDARAISVCRAGRAQLAA